MVELVSTFYHFIEKLILLMQIPQEADSSFTGNERSANARKTGRQLLFSMRLGFCIHTIWGGLQCRYEISFHGIYKISNAKKYASMHLSATRNKSRCTKYLGLPFPLLQAILIHKGEMSIATQKPPFSKTPHTTTFLCRTLAFSASIMDSTNFTALSNFPSALTTT